MRSQLRVLTVLVAVILLGIISFTTTLPYRLLPSLNNQEWRVHGLPTDSEVAALGIHRPPYSTDSSKLAVLIERRNVTQLAPVLIHFITVIPPSWRFRFYGSKESIAFIKLSLPVKHYERTGKLEIFEMPDALATGTMEEQSQTFTNWAFWSHLMFPATHVLLFQTDSIVCANSGRSVDDYLRFAYVGAPWRIMPYGGNGGLSLRRVDVMKNILVKYERRKWSDSEDLWFGKRLTSVEFPPGVELARTDDEKSFSVESIHNDRPLGYHLGGSGAILNKRVWFTPEQREHIYEYCPEIKIILDMVPPYQSFPCHENQTQIYNSSLAEIDARIMEELESVSESHYYGPA